MIRVCKQSTDSAKNDEALPRHQFFPDLVARFGGRRILQLLVVDVGACPLLVWMVVFTVVISF